MTKDLIRSFSGAVPLKRKGSRLSSAVGSWQMQGVYGPLSLEPGDELGQESERQFFRIETTARETLWVFRRRGERGMRDLFLFDVSQLEQKAVIPTQSLAG